jgi:hypothetical protein
MNYTSSEKNRQLEQTKLQEAQQTQQKIQEQAKQEQDKNKQALTDCLQSAETDYSEWWYQACKAKGLLSERCISLHGMTLADYAKEKNISADKQWTVFSDFEKEKSDCSCLLPSYNSDSIDKSRQDEKDVCFKQYPQK